MLTWEKLSDHTYRARLPIFGNVRVESYTAGKWNVNASVPGISMSLIEQSFKTEAEALDAVNALVTDACRDFLGQAPTCSRGDGMSDKLIHLPITLNDANCFVDRLHRHHPKVQGHKFSIGAILNESIVGVVIVGRPVSRHRDDGSTLEVTRLCTDGTRNACSFLYGKAARAAFSLGYSKIGTYALPDEGGASLRAAGWKLLGERGGGEWSSPSRPRLSSLSPTGQKLLWEVNPTDSAGCE